MNVALSFPMTHLHFWWYFVLFNCWKISKKIHP